MKIKLELRECLREKQTWSAEPFSRYFTLKIRSPTDIGERPLRCWRAPLTWSRVVANAWSSAAKETYTLLSIYAASCFRYMLFLVACHSNKLFPFLSRAPDCCTLSLHQEPPATAASCPEGWRRVGVCSFVLHLQEGVMMVCHSEAFLL